MALYYRNRRTGREAEVLEPDELAAKLRTIRRRGKPLDEDRIEIAKKHRKQLIEKMDDSWKWERLSGKPKAKAGQKSGKGDGQKSGEGNGAGQSGEGNDVKES